MRLRLLTPLVLILGTAASTVLADPVPLSPGNTWLEQYELMGASGETFAYQYIATQDETVLISGYYENTDQYQVLVNGSLALTTPAVPGPAIDYGDSFGTYMDPSNATFDSGLFSTGVLNVMANDVLTIVDIGPLYPDSGSFDAQVGLSVAPEPGTFAIAGLALLSMLALVRRRVQSNP